MATRRRLSLSYGELSEYRQLYRPRHAAPTLMARLLHRIERVMLRVDRSADGERQLLYRGERQPLAQSGPQLPGGRPLGLAADPVAAQATARLRGGLTAEGLAGLAIAAPVAVTAEAAPADPVDVATYRYILLPTPVA